MDRCSRCNRLQEDDLGDLCDYCIEGDMLADYFLKLLQFVDDENERQERLDHEAEVHLKRYGY